MGKMHHPSWTLILGMTEFLLLPLLALTLLVSTKHNPSPMINGPIDLLVLLNLVSFLAEERLLAHCEKMQAELEQWGELRNTPRGWQRLDED